ncbi:hypothetical protein [Candidatus Marinarcus aquaticus]|uniref:Uncharacterized protein n=1 Tax=Candidatus Marinarcus aquaticus TaxID=2044504 RepID=A0A4Q0XUR5_9BACT|nr:hypothetical protein [Candidatus Marinarcus aquaticus]RXJ57893.1 hypothetical protein CRV04_05140 [Candidatus Marinarcus aquaticus]
MKRELIIFVGIFLILTLGMHHKEWFSHPIEHLQHLPNAGAYGIGAIHPLVFTLVVYVMGWVPRGIYRLIKRSSKNK